MNYSEAIDQVFKKFGLDIISDPFLARSILHDYIGIDFEAKHLVEILILINQHINIVELFKTNTIKSARDKLNVLYQNDNLGISSKDFVSAINPVSKFIRPDEFYTNVKQEEAKVVACAGFVRVNKKTINHHQHQKVIVKNINNNPPQVVRNLHPVQISKPKRKIYTPRDATKLLFDLYCKNFTLQVTNTVKQPTIYEGKLLLSVVPKIRGIEAIYKICSAKSITVLIPERIYDKIIVKGLCSASCHIKGDKLIPLRANKLEAHAECKLLTVDSEVQFLNVKMRNGKARIAGNYAKITGIQYVGDVEFILDTKRFATTSVHYQCDKGNIYGEFKDMKISPMSTNISPQYYATWHKCATVNTRFMDIYLFTKYGRIKFK